MHSCGAQHSKGSSNTATENAENKHNEANFPSKM